MLLQLLQARGCIPIPLTCCQAACALLNKGPCALRVLCMCTACNDEQRARASTCHNNKKSEKQPQRHQTLLHHKHLYPNLLQLSSKQRDTNSINHDQSSTATSMERQKPTPLPPPPPSTFWSPTVSSPACCPSLSARSLRDAPCQLPPLSTGKSTSFCTPHQ